MSKGMRAQLDRVLAVQQNREALSKRGLTFQRLMADDELVTFVDWQVAREAGRVRTDSNGDETLHLGNTSRAMIGLIMLQRPEWECNLHPDGDGPYVLNEWGQTCPCHWWIDEDDVFVAEGRDLQLTDLRDNERPVW